MGDPLSDPRAAAAAAPPNRARSAALAGAFRTGRRPGPERRRRRSAAPRRRHVDRRRPRTRSAPSSASCPATWTRSSSPTARSPARSTPTRAELGPIQEPVPLAGLTAASAPQGSLSARAGPAVDGQGQSDHGDLGTARQADDPGGGRRAQRGAGARAAASATSRASSRDWRAAASHCSTSSTPSAGTPAPRSRARPASRRRRAGCRACCTPSATSWSASRRASARACGTWCRARDQQLHRASGSWATLGELVKDIAVTASLVAIVAAPFAAPELPRPTPRSVGEDAAAGAADGADARERVRRRAPGWSPTARNKVATDGGLASLGLRRRAGEVGRGGGRPRLHRRAQPRSHADQPG